MGFRNPFFSLLNQFLIWGFSATPVLPAFCLLSRKKQKFISLVEAILNSSHVSITDLQRLAGKCISMSMAVPGARLFTNEINLAISRASRSSRPLPLSGPLRREIEHWLFLKVTVDLQGCLPKNHSYARRLCFNHRRVYIIVKLIKCKIRKNKHF